MNTPQLTPYEQSKTNLLAELDAWDKFDSEREPLPPEIEEVKAQAADFGPSGSIIRARHLIPLILIRFEEDIRDKAYPYDLVVQLLGAATVILAAKREWISGARQVLDPDVYPSPLEKSVMNAANIIKSVLKKWTVPDIRFKNDMKRLFLDLWIIGSWLLDFADNSRRHGEWPPAESRRTPQRPRQRSPDYLRDEPGVA